MNMSKIKSIVLDNWQLLVIGIAVVGMHAHTVKSREKSSILLNTALEEATRKGVVVDFTIEEGLPWKKSIFTFKDIGAHNSPPDANCGQESEQLAK